MHWPATELPWRRPSPNLPDYHSAAWYPGICLLEFSGVSVGRGSDAPFQIIGAPWFDTKAVLHAMQEWPPEILCDISTGKVEFTPAHGEHANGACQGLRFQGADSGLDIPDRVVPLGLALLSTLHQTHEEFSEQKMRAALPLLGSPAVLQTLLDNDINTALKLSHDDAAQFQARREQVLIYP